MHGLVRLLLVLDGDGLVDKFGGELTATGHSVAVRLGSWTDAQRATS